MAITVRKAFNGIPDHLQGVCARISAVFPAEGTTPSEIFTKKPADSALPVAAHYYSCIINTWAFEGGRVADTDLRGMYTCAKLWMKLCATNKKIEARRQREMDREATERIAHEIRRAEIREKTTSKKRAFPSMEWDAEAKRRETLAARVDFGFEKKTPSDMHGEEYRELSDDAKKATKPKGISLKKVA